MSKIIYGITSPTNYLTTRPHFKPDESDIAHNEDAYKQFIDLVQYAAQNHWVIKGTAFVNIRTPHFTCYYIQGITGFNLALLQLKNNKLSADGILPLYFYGLPSELKKSTPPIAAEHTVVGWVPSEDISSTPDNNGLLRMHATKHSDGTLHKEHLDNICQAYNTGSIQQAFSEAYAEFNHAFTASYKSHHDHVRINGRILFVVVFFRAFELEHEEFLRTLASKSLIWQTSVEVNILPRLIATACSYVDHILAKCSAYGYVEQPVDQQVIENTLNDIASTCLENDLTDEGVQFLDDGGLTEPLKSVSIDNLTGKTLEPTKVSQTTISSSLPVEPTISNGERLEPEVQHINIEHANNGYFDNYGPEDTRSPHYDRRTTATKATLPTESKINSLEAIFDKDMAVLRDIPIILYPQESVEEHLKALWHNWRKYSKYFKAHFLIKEDADETKHKNQINNELLTYRASVRTQLNRIDNGYFQAQYIDEISFKLFEAVDSDRVCVVIKDSLIRHVQRINPNNQTNDEKSKSVEIFQYSYSSLVTKIKETLKSVDLRPNVCELIVVWWITTFGLEYLTKYNMPTFLKWLQKQESILELHRTASNHSFYDEALALIETKEDPQKLISNFNFKTDL